MKFVILILTQVAIVFCNSCLQLENCSSCIQNPECSWCSQPDYHGQTKQQLPRCNTPQGHGAHGRFQCETKHLFAPANQLKVDRNVSLTPGTTSTQRAVPMQPQRVSLQLRVGEQLTFKLKYKEVEDYPLDLYYLMDGTYTMKDDKDVLASVGESIGETLRTLTSRYRIGFGTFVDKTTMPFVSTVEEFLDNPCYVRNYTCVRPYGFKNHMKLDSDTSGFARTVHDVVLSASTDLPEGGFDALMQVMVCNEQIGWLDQARRLVLFATDAPFHYAGDGWLGGTLLPNDGQCHMDPTGEYYSNLIQDYPSMALINSKAKQHSVTLIFAVTADQLPDYELLKNVVEGAKTTELAKNSSNIVKLIEEEYEKIKSKLEIKDTFPSEYFRVKYHTRCLGGGGLETETNVCDGLSSGVVVEFRVEITLTKCPVDSEEWKRSYRIYAVGVPDGLDVDVEMLCDCPCEKPDTWTHNSSLCNHRGSESCGLCVCDDNYFGKWCECDGGKGVKDLNDCRQNNSSETCSGRGVCVCGQCQCSDRQRYSGQFCECDNNNCALIYGLLCAGHGECKCGECVCHPGWSGPACDCSTIESTCMAPGDEKLCSGQGDCFCGQCECNGFYSGAYCDRCLHELCPTECGALKHCVQCKVHGTGVYDSSDCKLNCYNHSIHTLDALSVIPGSTEVLCKELDPTDDCAMVFSYLKQPDKTFQIKAQFAKECPPKAPIFWILVAVASVVVLIGLVCFCAWRVWRTVQVKREFAKYERERVGVKWGEETNPLYASPVGTFMNPLYAGHHDKMS